MPRIPKYPQHPMTVETASLYLHVPFCAGACAYCDFYSLPTSNHDPRLDAFVDRLLWDTENQLDNTKVSRISSLYIGGGTPSLLGGIRIKRLLEGLRSILPSWPEECTLEANPESLDEQLLYSCRDGGITRISVGIQSLNERSRRAVRRIGSSQDASRALQLLSQAYPGYFSADLISGLPYQESEDLLKDIDLVLSSGTAHVSLYALTLEEGTVLMEDIRHGRVRLPQDAEADELWIRGRDALMAAGLEHYEVSNFALSGARCRHNEGYWRMDSWLGCGPAASGTLIEAQDAPGGSPGLGLYTALRLTVPSDVDAYLNGPIERRREELRPKDFLFESLLMAFRTSNGLDQALFSRRFGAPVEAFIGKTLATWRKRSLLQSDRLALTEAGLLFLDPFLVDCLSELDEAPSLGKV